MSQNVSTVLPAESVPGFRYGPPVQQSARVHITHTRARAIQEEGIRGS